MTEKRSDQQPNTQDATNKLKVRRHLGFMNPRSSAAHDETSFSLKRMHSSAAQIEHE